jgi:hypothetical protein
MSWVLGPGTHDEIEQRIHKNPNFRDAKIHWVGGAWHDNCGLVHKHVGIVHTRAVPGDTLGYIVKGRGGYAFTPPEGDLPCSKGAFQGFSANGTLNGGDTPPPEFPPKSDVPMKHRVVSLAVVLGATIAATYLIYLYKERQIKKEKTAKPKAVEEGYSAWNKFDKLPSSTDWFYEKDGKETFGITLTHAKYDKDNPWHVSYQSIPYTLLHYGEHIVVGVQGMKEFKTKKQAMVYVGRLKKKYAGKEWKRPKGGRPKKTYYELQGYKNRKEMIEEMKKILPGETEAEIKKHIDEDKKRKKKQATEDPATWKKYVARFDTKGLAMEALEIDGEHHKQRLLHEIAKRLGATEDELKHFKR